jgi:hypothetical protein
MNERWRESMYNIILAYYFRRILPELIIYHNKRILDRGIGYPTILPRVVICHLYFCDYNIFRRGTRKCSSCFLLVTRFPPYRDWHRKHIIFAENHHLLQWCLFLTTIHETSFSDSGRQSEAKQRWEESDRNHRGGSVSSGSWVTFVEGRGDQRRFSSINDRVGLMDSTAALYLLVTCSAEVRTFSSRLILSMKNIEITFMASVGNFPYIILRNSVAVVIADSRLFQKLT